MKPIILDLKPSIYLLTAFLSIGGLALLCLWVSDLSMGWKLSISVIVSALTTRTVLQHALLKAKKSVIQVRITEKGECWLYRQSAAAEQITLSYECVIHPLLTTLCWRARFMSLNAVLVVPDNVDAEVFRQLRVWMLWAKSK